MSLTTFRSVVLYTVTKNQLHIYLKLKNKENEEAMMIERHT